MRRDDEHKRFAKRLENERPQPSDEFMSAMTGRLAKRSHRAGGWRIAFAGGLTTVLVLAFALTGGIGYAASAVKGGTTAVTTLVVGPSKADKAEKVDRSTAQGNSVSNQSVNQSASKDKGDKGEGEKGNDKSSARKQYEDKIVICHRPPGNPRNAHTITISRNAWPAHQAHGDTMGPCPNGR